MNEYLNEPHEFVEGCDCKDCTPDFNYDKYEAKREDQKRDEEEQAKFLEHILLKVARGKTDIADAELLCSVLKIDSKFLDSRGNDNAK